MVRTIRLVCLAGLALAFGGPLHAGPPAAGRADAAKDPRVTVLDAMQAELTRSMQKLKLPGYEAPYFIAYTVRDNEDVDLVARNGALYAASRSRSRSAYVEVRVGDYQFDNTADAKLDGDWSDVRDELYEPGSDLPLDDDPEALRAGLWLATDARYKEALTLLHQKRGRRATQVVDDERRPSFSKTKAVKFIEPPLAFAFEQKRWEADLRAAAAVFKKHPDVFDSAVSLSGRREVRYLTTSEGTRLITERVIWSVALEVVVRADDGNVLSHAATFYGAADGEVPSGAAIIAAAEKLAGEAEALRRAPTLDPYTGPAILLPEATGVLFHEVIGHRLEGERFGSDEEGQTFKGQLGQRIIPEFLDVVDDPTTPRLGAKALNGFYRFDDEGVAAQAVTLIAKGVLRAVLLSRKPTSAADVPNGHGRADGVNDPMARMGVTTVRSSKAVPMAKLEEMLVDEARRQGKPYGLIIFDVTGGNTNTGAYGYQAFKGTPQLVYKVDAKTREKTLVRGVEMVGTPLTAINKIVATSDESGVFNGYCGAESGFVPVSTVAPAVLLTEIELQRAQKVKQKAQILPAPWRKTP
jgi:predicted Zn-dependent protease